MEVVGAATDGSKYMVRREQELARDMSAFLAVILKLLSIAAAGITVYGVYKFRSGSVSPLASSFNNFFTWIYLIGGLLFALVLFALGHVFTMLISVSDRQELAALGILTDDVSAQPVDDGGLAMRPSWQQSQWPSGMPTVVDSSRELQLRQDGQMAEASSPQAAVTEALEPSTESATRQTQNSPSDSKGGFWKAMTKERHFFASDDE